MFTVMRQVTNPTVINSHARESPLCNSCIVRTVTHPAASCSEHLINCRDLAAAFLLYERAILERPQEVAGEHL